MKTVIVAFDIDGTLRCSCTPVCKDVNMDVVDFAERLNHMKNVSLIAWSGGGKEYTQQFIRSDPSGLLYHLFGERCYSKLDAPAVDLAVDDQHEFSLGKVNLIVRAK